MQAWQVHENGEPSEVMRLADVAPPTPGDGQVLLRVRAANINFPDALLCRGQYQVRPPLPFTPGVEICGETEDGRRVIANPALPHGGFAEYAVADAAALLPAPDALDDAEAAALHIGYQTGWFGLHRRAGLEAGETLLVHAAAGGVGSAAVQLGKAAGATVIGVVGGAEKAAVARDLGCDVVDRPARRGRRRRRQGGHRRPGRRRDLRPGRRRGLHPVRQGRRLRGPDRGRRLRQRHDPQPRRSTTPW